MIDLVKNFSITARRMKKSVIRELLKVVSQPGIISFAGGLPSPDTFPMDVFEDIVATVLRNEGRNALQYSATEGERGLKEELVKWMARDNVHVSSEHILVTVASQQGLDLVSKVFIDPSDPVVVELPSYLGGLQAFACYGANMIGVPTDDSGIRTDILEEKLFNLRREGEHYKFIYLVPDFQNPAGITLCIERRRQLLKMSKEYEVLILEDTPYRELRFEGITPPSLYSMDNTGNVVSLHTFSKIFVPGLRLGWVVADPSIIAKLAVAKQSADLCTPAFNQCIAAEFMRRGLLEGHIEKIRTLYRRKKEVMLSALEEHMPIEEGLRWTKPEGGLFLWVVLPERVDADEMFLEAIDEKVAYVVGSAFHCNGGGKNTMRLNFSYPTEDEIHEGIKRLAKAVKKRLVKPGRVQEAPKVC